MVGSPDIRLTVNGEIFTFEFSNMFGPLFQRKEPGAKHVFWKALKLWCEQGERLDVDRNCVWNAIEQRDMVEHIVGKHYRVIGQEMAVPEWYIPPSDRPEQSEGGL